MILKYFWARIIIKLSKTEHSVIKQTYANNHVIQHLVIVFILQDNTQLAARIKAILYMSNTYNFQFELISIENLGKGFLIDLKKICKLKIDLKKLV